MVILLLVIFYVFLLIVVGRMAVALNRNAVAWILASALLISPLIGMVILLCLPYRGLKTCPRCAEPVRNAAHVCPHCGQEFGPHEGRQPDGSWKEFGYVAGCSMLAVMALGAIQHFKAQPVTTARAETYEDLMRSMMPKPPVRSSDIDAARKLGQTLKTNGTVVDFEVDHETLPNLNMLAVYVDLDLYADANWRGTARSMCQQIADTARKTHQFHPTWRVRMFLPESWVVLAACDL